MHSKSYELDLKQMDDYEIFRLSICCLIALNLTKPIYRNRISLIKTRYHFLTELDFLNLYTIESFYKLINGKSVQSIASIICEQIEIVYLQIQIPKDQKQEKASISLTHQYLKRFNYIYNNSFCFDQSKNSTLTEKEINNFAIQAVFILAGI